MLKHRSSVAALIAPAGLGALAHVAEPQARANSAPPRPRRQFNTYDTELQREIAEHNAMVDRRKAEKKAAKRK